MVCYVRENILRLKRMTWYSIVPLLLLSSLHWQEYSNNKYNHHNIPASNERAQVGSAQWDKFQWDSTESCAQSGAHIIWYSDCHLCFCFKQNFLSPSLLEEDQADLPLYNQINLDSISHKYRSSSANYVNKSYMPLNIIKVESRNGDGKLNSCYLCSIFERFFILLS